VSPKRKPKSQTKKADKAPQSYGEVTLKDGSVEQITAFFTIYRDEREVTICNTSEGSIAVLTKSWLKQNNRELVETLNLYTKETFVMAIEAILLGSEYLGIDLQDACAKLHADQGAIKYECAGGTHPQKWEGVPQCHTE
jgi:hypothetical protein